MTAAPVDRRRAALPFLALGTLVVMLLAGMLVPIYTDEIGWRFQERAAVDGVDIMFNDLCGLNTIAAAPWFMMPVRTFSAMANQSLASPLFVRIEGIACALVWSGLLWLLTGRIESDGTARARVRTVLYSLLALGMLPFLLDMSRPEQPLILTLSLAMLIALSSRAVTTSWQPAAIKCTAIVALGWIALSYHLKGVAYSPAFFACLTVCASGRRTLWPRLAGGAVLAALTIAAAQYWAHRFQCHGDPLMAEMLAGENVAALLSSGGNGLSVAGAMAKGLNPLNYFWLAVPAYNLNWLPSPLSTFAQTTVFALAIFVLWGGVFACAVYALMQYCWQERLRALGEPRAMIALALLGCLAAWGASQLHRNPYEASHYMPMTAVLCALCFTLPMDAANWRARVLDFFAKLAVPVAVASAVAILASSMGPLRAVSSHTGWIPSLRVSVSAYGYPQVRRDIATAMDRAGMGGDRRFNRLLVDDVTYLALQRDTMPLHRLGVLGDWHGEITDPVAYLRSRNSDGVVMGCRYLPPRMRTVAGRAGEVCAISREGLDKLAASGPTALGQGEQY